ncbi:hypothetical protein [Corynebacterium occultum]|nr:hypothetical protein [Corynebacterium occultum]
MDELDLRFLPSESRFIQELPQIEEISCPTRLVVANSDPVILNSIADRVLQNTDVVLELIWNIERRSDIAHALSPVAERANFSQFRVVEGTAHLLLSASGDQEISAKRPGLIPSTPELLEEIGSESVPMPPQLFKQLLWRYSYLLEHFDDANSKYDNVFSQLERVKREKKAQDLELKAVQEEVADLSSVNSDLDGKLRELDSEHSKLQSSYNALASSKLGSMTLKYWARRNNRA